MISDAHGDIMQITWRMELDQFKIKVPGIRRFKLRHIIKKKYTNVVEK